jgi:hypothetical protein
LIRFRLADERGSALVTGMLVMMIFVSMTFVTMQLVDNQQGESRKERERESSFTLAEGVLNAQIYLLSRQWPGKLEQEYPVQCTKASAAESECPDSATLQKSFSGADFDEGLDWTTEIHDNVAGAEQFYQDATVREQARYDSNRDGIVWVRAQSNIRGKRRTLVALIRAERLDTLFPRNVVVANRITVGPNGNQTYISTAGSYAVLRCNGPSGTQLSDAQCKNWGRPEHVGPNGDVRIIPGQRPAMSPETIDRFRETAKSTGTYYATCPPEPPTLTGAIVFIERSNGCTFDGPGNSQWNTPEEPGILMVGSGTIGFKGNALYNGVVYMVNGSDEYPGSSINSGDVVTVQGNACIFGAVVIDGPGGIAVGSSNGANRCAGNIAYSANASENLRAFGTAGIVQNSFREIVADD